MKQGFLSSTEHFLGGRRLRRDSGQAHGDSLEPPVRAPGLGT